MEIDMTLAELKTLERLLMKFQGEFGGEGSDLIDVDQENAVVRTQDTVSMVASIVEGYEEDV